MNIVEALNHPELFGPHFRGDSWQAAITVHKGLHAIPMNDAELAIFKRHTGLVKPPSEPVTDATIIAGRRAGKDSAIAAPEAVFLAAFRDYRQNLAPGERGTVMVIAADRRRAQVAFGYIAGLIDSIPMLAAMVQSRTREAIHLENRISIEVHTASFRAVRGYTIVAAILDEIAFWRSEDSANPDVEIINALRPGMATVSGALMLKISSPYARRGVLWDDYRRHYGNAEGPLVWKAPSRAMNPTLPQHVVDSAYAEDEARASAEYGAEFRTDVESFVSREAVDAVVIPGRRELPHVSGESYVAFVDPSGGSSDSMTLAIAHEEDETAVLDLVRDVRPPFSPADVVARFCETLKQYGIHEVTGDRYGGEFCREPFRQHGIDYTLAEKSKSDLYAELLPTINSEQCELLDHPKLVAQIVGLERRTSRSGRDSIDHGPGGHDDLANAVAGVLYLLRRRLPPLRLF